MRARLYAESSTCVISFHPEEPREAGAIFTRLGCEKRGSSDNPRVPSACTLEPHRLPGLTRPSMASLTASPGCAPRPQTRPASGHLQHTWDCTQHFIGLADLPEGLGCGTNSVPLRDAPSSEPVRALSWVGG